jgi:ribosome-associated protein
VPGPPPRVSLRSSWRAPPLPDTSIRPTNPDPMAASVPHPAQTSLEIAQRAASILLEHKANDVVLLSLEGVSDMTDFFLIASGTSDTHVRSLGNSVLEDMKRDSGQMAHHVEGLSQGRWVLLDYVDVVVHIFHPTLRSFYQIERLWADAETVPLQSTR